MAKKTETKKTHPVFGGLHAVAVKAIATKDATSVISRILIRNGKAVATDGYILAIRNLPETLKDVECLVPASAVKTTSKAKDLEITVSEQGHVTLKDGNTAIACPPDHYSPSNFPPYEQIIPDNQGLKVSLNAEHLKRLADAITSDGIVTLTFNADGNPNKPINVSGELGTGVIMPVRM